MSRKAPDVESFIAKELHSLLFLEEFVFSRTKFSPPSGSELELADAVVMLGDALLIFQIKERSPNHAGDTQAESRWFKKEVLGKATKQVRDTLRYLQTYSEIRVPNERGRVFNLAGTAFAEILKVVVYQPTPNLPDDCRSVRHYVSKTAGFIHIVDAHDYLELSRTLRVPEEVVRFFKYREMLLTNFTECAGLPESVIAGHFIGGDPNELPTVASARHLHRLVQDEEEWNLAPFLRGLHDHLSVPGIGDDYYDILIEFAKLPRSAWRKVKERILLCVEKAKKDEFARPYRITFPRTDCGFVFIPVLSELVMRSDWPTIRLRGIQQLTQAHKYDQHLSKCIGILVAKDGDYFDILWCLVAHPWTEDSEFQKALNDNFPFRPVKDVEVRGYLFSEE
ncbi:hypothetical protein [Rhodoblastus sp.]|uniref:hypothetical protein n=1 Tax=Rhodoblastus sp. TaxID=1962975 RepID=UPI003F99F786